MSACLPLPVADRIRFLARALGIVFLLGWASWFWPFDDRLDRQGTPLGADFSMFFVAGEIAAAGEWELLYDQATHQRRLQALFPGLDPRFCLPYRYPPAVALGLAPLPSLGYPTAWVMFTAASLAAAAASLVLLRRSHPSAAATRMPAPPASESEVVSPHHPPRREDWRTAATWACVGWPVALEVLIGGQASMFALLIAVASSRFVLAQRFIAAGACLACAAYKPNVLGLFAVGVAVRHPRVLWGAVPVLALGLLLNLSGGWGPLQEFLQLSSQLATATWDVETPFWKVHSLAPLLDLLFPGTGKRLSVVIGLLAAIGVGGLWRLADRRGAAGGSLARLSLAALLVVNALFNPYTPIYDLVLLGAAAWLVAEVWATAKGEGWPSGRVAQFWLAGLFFGPHLSQACAKALGIQLFPLLLAAVAAWLAAWQLAGGERRTLAPTWARTS